MASFTLYLWEVCDSTHDPGDGSKIGLDAYPLPDFLTTPADQTAWRTALNKKIIAHYWNREIGMETISLFTFAVARRMNEQMPYLNQLYKSAQIQFDPLSTFNLTTTRNDTGTEHVSRDSASGNDGTVTSGTRSVNSDTPQVPLSGNGDYASALADVNGVTTTKQSGTGNDTTDGTNTLNAVSKTSGYQGSAADLLTKYRATLLNLDMVVLEALADCFMQVWDNGDEFIPQIGTGRYA